MIKIPHICFIKHSSKKIFYLFQLFTLENFEIDLFTQYVCFSVKTNNSSTIPIYRKVYLLAYIHLTCSRRGGGKECILCTLRLSVCTVNRLSGWVVSFRHRGSSVTFIPQVAPVRQARCSSLLCYVGFLQLTRPFPQAAPTVLGPCYVPHILLVTS